MVSDDDVIAGGAGIESALLILSVSVEDGGRYLCSAELNGDTVTTEAYLNITEGICTYCRLISYTSPLSFGNVFIA